MVRAWSERLEGGRGCPWTRRVSTVAVTWQAAAGEIQVCSGAAVCAADAASNASKPLSLP